MTSDGHEKHICVYLVDFVQFLPGANLVRGAFEDCLEQNLSRRDKPSAFV